MSSLKSLCVSWTIDWIFQVLIQRKKALAKFWIVETEKWISAMKLEEIRSYLSDYCIASTFEMLLEQAQDQFKESRYHDLLICCYHLFLNEFTVKITIPECLKTDQVHRRYLLSTLKNYPRVRKLDFRCFNGNRAYYVSDEEQKLLEENFKVMNELTLVQLSNVVNNEILQELISNCQNLTVLLINSNKSVNDASVCIITKTHELIRKGALVKLKALKNSAPSAIKLLDIRNTDISANGKVILAQYLPECKIVQQ